MTGNLKYLLDAFATEAVHAIDYCEGIRDYSHADRAHNIAAAKELMNLVQSGV